jgi:signal transduction histidine kinase
MRRIVRGDEPAGEGEYEVPPRVVHWLNLPVLAGAVPVGRLLVLRDVTEQRAVERLRDDLTHTMVHDLRNPLSGISTSLALFDFDALDSTQRELLTIAAQSADRMLGLVNAILDVSRLESGQMPLERAAVDADLLAAEAVRLQTALAAERRLQLQNAVPAGLPAVNVDPTLIGRVLQNLIGNAIKFTPAGGRVTLNARRAGSRLEMSVSDTGPGIAPELLGKLFQKFVTGHEKERGSGLGLAFCRLAVEAHGGRLSVESAPERGTTFRFTLPLAESEAPLP